MKSVLISNIEWDTNGKSPEDFNLPSEIRLDNIPDETVSSKYGLAGEIADLLSDDYGWCVNAFTTEVLEKEEP